MSFLQLMLKEMPIRRDLEATMEPRYLQDHLYLISKYQALFFLSNPESMVSRLQATSKAD